MENVPRSALVQRVQRLLGRLGLNVGPWLELQRARINRPIVQRLEVETVALRGLIADQDAILRDMIASQDTTLREVLAGREAALREALTAQEVTLNGALAIQEAARLDEASALARRLAVLDERSEVLTQLLAHVARGALAVPAVPLAAEMPEVSVIMPVRNRVELVEHAIRSVQRQGGVALELLVVDDGSTDGSAEVVTRLAEADPRIRLFRETARGHSSARNVALAAARGEFFAYLDSDNVWMPEFLKTMLEAFRKDAELQAAYGMLVADEPIFGGQVDLWRPFDPVALEEGNSIDINTYVHRRWLYEECGGFDEAMTRLVDWDLVLRHSDRTALRRIPVIAAAYRTGQPDRVTFSEPFGPSLYRVRSKRLKPGQGARPPRVLYAVWHYPQLTESYIETEIRCMQRLGAEIEVWSEADVAAPYEPAVPFRRGSLEDAIAAFRPDVVHIHWLGLSGNYASAIAEAGLPMTVRAHGFETTAASIRAALALGPLAHLYLFPGMAVLAPEDPRVRIVQAAFDTQLFPPATRPLDRKLVLRTGAALASKDYTTFFEAAARLPDHRFVLVVGTCFQREHVPDELRALNQNFGGHAEILVDVPREQVAELMEEAGIYLHTAAPIGAADATPIGAPISIVEAMSSGTHVLVRDIPELAAYVEPAGATYSGIDEAVDLIRETTRWDDAAWNEAGRAALDVAWSRHADVTALAGIYEDWCALAAARDAGRNSFSPLVN